MISFSLKNVYLYKKETLTITIKYLYDKVFSCLKEKYVFLTYNLNHVINCTLKYYLFLYMYIYNQNLLKHLYSG